MKPWRGARGPGSVGALLLLGWAAVLVSCQAHAPEIHDHAFELTLVDDREEALLYETASVYLRVYDADGVEDLDALFVIHDDAELFWELTPETWTTTEIDDDVWVGADRLTMPGLARFPGGAYRLLLRDLSGEEVEIPVEATGRPEEERRPRVTVDGDIMTVAPDRGLDAYEIWIYEGGRRIGLHPGGPRANLRTLVPPTEPAAGYDIYLYWRDPGNQAGYLSGPFPYRPAPGGRND